MDDSGTSWHNILNRILNWGEKNLWLLLIGIGMAYLVGLAIYHSVVPVDSSLWQQTARYRVADYCHLLVEYPARLRLNFDKQVGLPVTMRIWVAPPSEAGGAPACEAESSLDAASSYYVSLGPLGAGIDFVNADGEPALASVPVDVAFAEGAAAPARIYVTRAPEANLEPVALDVWVWVVSAQEMHALVPTVLEGNAPVIELESERSSRRRRLLGILFDPGPLQLTVIAAGMILGVRRGYKNLQVRRQDRRARLLERRTVLRQQVDFLRNSPPTEPAFRTYVALHAEFRDEPDSLEEVQSAFNRDWLPYLRRELGRLLRARQFDAVHTWLTDMQWEWQQAGLGQGMSTVRALVEALRQPVAQPSRHDVEQVLAAYRIVGLEATQPVLSWLECVQPDPQLVKEALFREGGAAGRYLLAEWGEQNGKVALCLKRWERDTWPSLPNSARAELLWPQNRGEPQTMWQGVRRLGLDFNPFGPEKAEQDPRLPELFYYASPVWEEVMAPRPSVFVVPPGCGRSALIWMLRYKCGLVGSAVEGVFPVHVPVHDACSFQELQAIIHKSVATALCWELARDPYGLLGLDNAAREERTDLLLGAFGGLAPLLKHLRAVGLQANDADARLLEEALALEAHTRDAWHGTNNGHLLPLHPYGRAYTFLLMDIGVKEEDQLQALVDTLFDRCLALWSPRHLVPKVFISSRPAACSVNPIQVRWEADALCRLLRHRLQRAGLVLADEGSVLRGWVEGVDDPDQALLEAAAGRPARLVRLGNRLIRRLAQPQVLTRQEYFDRVLDAEAV